MKTKLFLFIAPFLSLMLTGCADHTTEESESHLKRLLLLNITYSNEHDLVYPNLSNPDTIKADLSPMIAKRREAQPGDGWSADIFIDSVSDQPFVPNANMSRIYAGKIENPFTTIAFYAPQPKGDKRLVGFMDGHIKWVDELEWPQVKATGVAP